MPSVSGEGEGKKRTPSNSFRVTFAGAALPEYILLSNLRLPVRLYVQRVMHCDNCKQLGHTKTYCRNKTKCIKCGEQHTEDSCNKSVEKCIYCEQEPHSMSACPKFQQHTEKVKRSLEGRSKRSYAEMLKAVNPATDNPYAILSDADDGSDGEYTIVISSGTASKRTNKPSQKRPPTDAKAPRKEQQRKVDKAAKPKAPGLQEIQSQEEFPSLPGTLQTQELPETPEVILPARNVATHTIEASSEAAIVEPTEGLFTLSGFVHGFIECFEIPDPFKGLILKFLPNIKKGLDKMILQWPLLASIISNV